MLFLNKGDYFIYLLISAAQGTELQCQMIPPLICFLCPPGGVAISVAQVPAQYSPPKPNHYGCPIRRCREWNDDFSAAQHEASLTWYVPASSSEKTPERLAALLTGLFDNQVSLSYVNHI